MSDSFDYTRQEQQRQQFNQAGLTKYQHNSVDLHMIGESIGAPTRVSNLTIGGSGSIGTSPFPAREDHVHGIATGVIMATAVYTPTLANMAVGTGGSARNDARYVYVGVSPGQGIISIVGVVIFGTSGTTFPGGSAETISMPTGYSLLGVTTIQGLGFCSFSQAGSAQSGLVRATTTTTVRPVVMNPATAFNNVADITATVPFTWAAGDSIHWVVNAPCTGP